MNYYEHHLGDYIRDTAHLSMLEDGAYRRLLSVYYVREMPLPAEHRECFKLARCTSTAERKAVQAVLEEFFTCEQDGYHQKRADEVIAAYHELEPEREQKRENGKERKRRSRERRRWVFEQLRAHGITPSFDSPMSELESQLSRVTGLNGHSLVTRLVTRDGTASQSHSPVPLPSPNLNPPPPTPSPGGKRGGGDVEKLQERIAVLRRQVKPGHAKPTELLELEEQIGAIQ